MDTGCWLSLATDSSEEAQQTEGLSLPMVTRMYSCEIREFYLFIRYPQLPGASPCEQEGMQEGICDYGWGPSSGRCGTCKWTGTSGSAAAEAAGANNPCALHLLFL